MVVIKDGPMCWGLAWGLGGVAVLLPGLLGRRFAMVVALLALPLPFLLPLELAMWRAVVALASFFYVVRAYEAIFQPRFVRESSAIRAIHVGCTFFDVQTRKALPAGERNGVAVNLALSLLSHAVRLVLAATLVLRRGDLLGEWRLAQTIAGFVGGGFYAMLSLEVFGLLLQLLFVLLGGFLFPPLMDQPLRSKSLREWWGKRWNTVIQGLLKRYVFSPLRQRGWSVTLASLATFIASGLLHTYPVFVAGLDIFSAVQMMSFFVVQCLLMLVEGSLNITSWGGVAGQVWTTGSIVLTSFLVLGPVFEMGGLGPLMM